MAHIWYFAIILLWISAYFVGRSIVMPINALIEAVENTNIEDEDIFKYKEDKDINELFVLVFEILNGKLVKNDGGSSTPSENLNNNNKESSANYIINNTLILEKMFMIKEKSLDCEGFLFILHTQYVLS